jgi:hypothetical protein
MRYNASSPDICCLLSAVVSMCLRVRVSACVCVCVSASASVCLRLRVRVSACVSSISSYPPSSTEAAAAKAGGKGKAVQESEPAHEPAQESEVDLLCAQQLQHLMCSAGDQLGGGASGSWMGLCCLVDLSSDLLCAAIREGQPVLVVYVLDDFLAVAANVCVCVWVLSFLSW